MLLIESSDDLASIGLIGFDFLVKGELVATFGFAGCELDPKREAVSPKVVFTLLVTLVAFSFTLLPN